MLPKIQTLYSGHFTNPQDKTPEAKPDTSSDKENKSDQTAASTGETNGEESAKDATKPGLATNSIFSDKKNHFFTLILACEKSTE